MAITPVRSYRIPDATNDKLKKLAGKSNTSEYLRRLIEYAFKNKLKV